MFNLGRMFSSNISRPSLLVKSLFGSFSKKSSPITNEIFLPSRGVKKLTKTIRTKTACAKRFRITPSGHLKCFPSVLHGRSKIIRRTGLVGGAKHLVKLLTNSNWKRVIPSHSKSEYLIPDRDFVQNFEWVPLNSADKVLSKETEPILPQPKRKSVVSISTKKFIIDKPI